VKYKASPLFNEIPYAAMAQSLEHIKKSNNGSQEWLFRCTAKTPGNINSKTYDFRACREFIGKAFFDENIGLINDVCVIFNGLDETPHELDEIGLFGFYN